MNRDTIRLEWAKEALNQAMLSTDLETAQIAFAALTRILKDEQSTAKPTQFARTHG